VSKCADPVGRSHAASASPVTDPAFVKDIEELAGVPEIQAVFDAGSHVSIQHHLIAAAECAPPTSHASSLLSGNSVALPRTSSSASFIHQLARPSFSAPA
jgi:hypothetical protein